MGRTMDGLRQLAERVVSTLGGEGSRIETATASHTIAPAPARAEVDRTGAGDAYRSGLVAGLLRGLDVPTAGAVASLAATYAVEQVGTIEHGYSHEEFAERFKGTYGRPLPVELWPAVS